MNKPKVLIFIDWFLPAYKAGGPVRSMANMIDQLHEVCEFYLVCGNEEYNETKALEVTPNEWVKNYNATIQYLSKDQRTEMAYKTIFHEINPDWIYINGIFSQDFSIKPLLTIKKENLQHKTIVASRGMFAPGALAVKKWKKIAFLSWAKMKGLYKGIKFHVTNEVESEQVKLKVSKNANTIIIANLPRKINVEKSLSGKKEKGRLKMVYIGRISPEKNCLFQLECLEGIKGKIELCWIGSVNDEAYYQSCLKKVEGLGQSLDFKHIEAIHPDNLMDAFENQHIFFHPTLGENFGHSILEAMQCGIPVLISDKTPWRKLEEKNLGWDLPLKKEMFLSKIQELVDSTEIPSLPYQVEITNELLVYKNMFDYIEE